MDIFLGIILVIIVTTVIGIERKLGAVLELLVKRDEKEEDGENL